MKNNLENSAYNIQVYNDYTQTFLVVILAIYLSFKKQLTVFTVEIISKLN